MASHCCAWYSPLSSQALHKVYNEPENMVWSWVCDPSTQGDRVFKFSLGYLRRVCVKQANKQGWGLGM